MSGAKLQKIRKDLGLTRKDFARRLGCSRTSLLAYEQATRVKRTVALAAKAIAAGLDDK